MNCKKVKLQKNSIRSLQKKSRHNFSAFNNERPSNVKKINLSCDFTRTPCTSLTKKKDKDNRVKECTQTARKKSTRDISVPSGCLEGLISTRHSWNHDQTICEKKRKKNMYKTVRKGRTASRNISINDENKISFKKLNQQNCKIIEHGDALSNFNLNSQKSNTKELLKQKLEESYAKTAKILEENDAQMKKLANEFEQNLEKKDKQILDLRTDLLQSRQSKQRLKLKLNHNDSCIHDLSDKIIEKEQLNWKVNDQLSKIQKENSKYFKSLAQSEDKIHELTQKVVEMDAYQKKLEEKVKYNESEKIQIKKNAQAVLSFIRNQYKKETDHVLVERNK